MAHTRPATSCALALLLAAATASANDRFADVEVRATAVAGNVHMLTGAGGNIGVSAGSDGQFMVDDQYGPLAERIKATLATLPGGDRPPRLILNTHHHGDHTGSNAAFGADSIIVAHHNVRARLAGGEQPAAALPVVTYGETLTVHLNGEAVELTHLPAAHTDGDTLVHFTASNVVHTGDIFFNGRFPYVDLDSGGDVLGLLGAITWLQGRINADTRIIPGHGPLAGPADLANHVRMLTECIQHVRAGMADGLDADALVERGVPAEWKDHAWGFITEERWIRILARSLSASDAAGNGFDG